MQSNVFLGLINNTALLLSLGLIYEYAGFRLKGSGSVAQQLLAGAVIGVVGIVLMLNPWDFGQGILFDTRSIVLCIAGLFFGTLPLLLATLITAAFRIFPGGSGILVGMAVIITSGALGLAWRHSRLLRGKAPSFAELYLLGIIVHLSMLACMFLLPSETVVAVLNAISLPVLLIYPPATAILGKLIDTRRTNRLAALALEQSEGEFRGIFQHHTAVKLLLDAGTGQIVEANRAAEKLYGWSVDQLKGMNIPDINVLDADSVKALAMDISTIVVVVKSSLNRLLKLILYAPCVVVMN